MSFSETNELPLSDEREGGRGKKEGGERGREGEIERRREAEAVSMREREKEKMTLVHSIEEEGEMKATKNLLVCHRKRWEKRTFE